MVALLVISVFVCSLVQLVYTEEVRELENKIIGMKSKSEALQEENKKLHLQLDEIKQACRTELEKWKSESHLEEVIDKERLVIAELSKNITQKKLDEQILLSALDREYVYNNKYYLLLEMYQHEIDQAQVSRQAGLNEKCHRYRPLLKTYESDFSARSLGGTSKNKTSHRAKLLLLLGIYNEQIHLVKRLSDSNELLTLQFENVAKMCEAEKYNLQELLKETDAKVKQVIGEKNIFLEEYSSVIEHLSVLNNELKELQEHNVQAKQLVLDTIKAMEEYSQDNECYQEFLNTNIFYE